jgi:hypothetical protein
MPTSKGRVSPQQSARQELNQQVARTSDSQWNVPHDDIVNPQEESTTLYSLSIDIGSIGAFQVVEPYLLVHVHDRTILPDLFPQVSRRCPLGLTGIKARPIQ